MPILCGLYIDILLMPNPKKPTAIKKKEGTYRKDRDGSTDKELGLSFLKTIPEPPKHLGKIAAIRWIEIVSEVSKVGGYVAKIDLAVLERYCMLWEHWRELAKEIQENGSVREAHKEGSEREFTRPQWKMWMDASKELGRIEREFGFTPGARSSLRLVQNAQKPDDETFEI